MGRIHTRTVRNLSKAPYRIQVEVHLIDMGEGTEKISAKESAKIERVKRFLPAKDCAREIVEAREAPRY